MDRQGENLYLFLFALYLNDLEEYLETSNIKKLEKLDNLALEPLNTYIKLFILLYADDTVIFSETLDELQMALESFEAYGKLWKLGVNVNKTKLVVFSKRKVKHLREIKIFNSAMETQDSYTYL